MELTDIMAQEKWEEFGAECAERTGLNAFAYDSKGEHVTQRKTWANQLCPVIRGNPKRSWIVCDTAHKHQAEIARNERKIVVGRCEAGLINISVPVFVDDEYVGLIGGCGLLPSEGVVDVKAVAVSTGMWKDLLEKLSAGVRALSREEIETLARQFEDKVHEILARRNEVPAAVEIKTFDHLIAEVHRKGLCHQCGGCVTFCTAMGYDALEFSETGRPRYRDRDKCIKCGICYLICPALGSLKQEVRDKLKWEEPMGRVRRVAVVRARDEEIRKVATDGGAVTAILAHLFDSGEIDGAAVTRQVGPFKRQPWLATSREDVLQSAGSNFDRSHAGSISLYTQDYTTYSPTLKTIGPMVERGLERVALVGTPCQVSSVRRMEVLGAVPSDPIYCMLGLFCSGNYIFGDARRRKIEAFGNFKWSDVVKVNIKDHLILTLASGDVRTIPLAELDFIKRFACRFCIDYAAWYADLSFGGIGAEDGWTTVVVRTSLGEKILKEALDTVLEEHPASASGELRDEVKEVVERHAIAKAEDGTAFRAKKGAEPM